MPALPVSADLAPPSRVAERIRFIDAVLLISSPEFLDAAGKVATPKLFLSEAREQIGKQSPAPLLTQRLLNCVPLHYPSGTPLMPLYLRLLR